MVQPTPQLLLRPAASLAAGLKLLAHPKVPLTPSESRQLLNIITTSFRHQLAQEHGNSLPEPAHRDSLPKSFTSNSDPLRVVEKSQSGPKAPVATPTDRHLHGILTNPLFSFQARPKPTGTRDPMDVFDEACASGLMTIDRARACLLAKKGILGGSPNDLPMRMKTSGAGAKVFKWLLSTGAVEDSSWLLSVDPRDKRIKHDIIFEFLILEGKQELLWELFEHYIARRQPKIGLLFYHLNKGLDHNVSLDAAYESLIRANDILNQSGISSSRRIAILRSSVYHLVYSTTHNTPWRTRPSPTLFDQFLGIVRAVVPPSTPRASLYMSRLHLCHPTIPDAKPALQYLKSLGDTPFENLNPQSSLSKVAPYSSQSLVWLALETAEHLLKHEQYEDARWVMGFLQTRYSDQIGAGPNAELKVILEHAEAEATNLQLLNNLELGLGGT